jgi:hypothetical protein
MNTIEISDSQIYKMKHALGISYSKSGKNTIPNKVYRPKLNSYRNYYQISQCNEWDDLVLKNLAVKGESIGMNYYFVTSEGIEYLKDLGYKFKKED